MTERSNPHVEPVFIRLGGKSYRLHIDLWSVAVAERDLGFTFLPAETETFTKHSRLFQTLAMLYMATRTYAPELTFQQIGQLATGPQFAQLVEAADRAATNFSQGWEPEGQRGMLDQAVSAAMTPPPVAESGGSGSNAPPATNFESPPESSGG